MGLPFTALPKHGSTWDAGRRRDKPVEGLRVTHLWSDLARGLAPYVPGEQPQGADVVKLNTNESPFGPSPAAIAAVEAAAGDLLRRYPDPQSSRLCEALAAYHRVRPDQVFVGNGSDEVLAHAFAALLKQPSPLRFPDITYGFYPIYCRLLGIAHEAVPLDAGMRIQVDDYLGRTGPVILANPNAPTGIALPLAEIARLVRGRAESAVVIDEAYVDFGAETAIPLIRDHPNLLVVQTMSKSRALAGLRVGYAIGDGGLIAALTRVKDSFNSYPLGRPAQAGAIASLGDEAYFQQTRAAIIRNRASLGATLARLGFEVLPSSANFVLARHPKRSGPALAAALRQRGVLVRHFGTPRIAEFLRITVGSEAELAHLADAFGEILAERQ